MTENIWYESYIFSRFKLSSFEFRWTFYAAESRSRQPRIENGRSARSHSVRKIIQNENHSEKTLKNIEVPEIILKWPFPSKKLWHGATRWRSTVHLNWELTVFIYFLVLFIYVYSVFLQYVCSMLELNIERKKIFFVHLANDKRNGFKLREMKKPYWSQIQFWTSHDSYNINTVCIRGSNSGVSRVFSRS